MQNIYVSMEEIFYAAKPAPLLLRVQAVIQEGEDHADPSVQLALQHTPH